MMEINIGWLFPTLLGTYGDRGNLLCLQRRAEWRGIPCRLIPIDEKSSDGTWEKIDLFVGGGAQDREQGIVMKNLSGGKAQLLTRKIRERTPALFTCAFFQLLGHHYKPSEGPLIKGIGLLDFITVHHGPNAVRCVGNAVLKITAKALCEDLQKRLGCIPYLIGFENHGGYTFLNEAESLASVVKGFGNNRKDGTEGVFYENAIGTYLHGPVLPKNPFLADWLLEKALQNKYRSSSPLAPLDDEYAYNARRCLLDNLLLRSI